MYLATNSENVQANKSFNNLDELENILAQRCLWLMEHPTVIKGVAGFKWLQTM